MTGAARQQLAGRAAYAGGGLGVLAGLLQLTLGSRMPTWSGDKDNPVGLGVLTVVLSIAAIIGGVSLRWPRPASGERRAAALAAVLVPADLCFSTVGRLWYLPGLVLFLAGAAVVTAGPAGSLFHAVRVRWLRVLISVLGGFELLMAVSVAPLALVAVGITGGLCLLVAPWTRPGTRLPLVLSLFGTLPFAVLTWWSIGTPLIAVLGIGLWLACQRADSVGRVRLDALVG